jgi:hypothetical protein
VGSLATRAWNKQPGAKKKCIERSRKPTSPSLYYTNLPILLTQPETMSSLVEPYKNLDSSLAVESTSAVSPIELCRSRLAETDLDLSTAA